MDITHKYPYTNFEQLNIDFLLESIADHTNKITQLRTDLTAETAARTSADTALRTDLTAETAARTAADAALRADLQTEINTRIGDVEILTAEDAAITAFANQIQADLTQEIADRASADDAMADLFRGEINDIIGDINTINSTLSAKEIQLFHLSYGPSGLDCAEDEAPYISRAFDTARRCMVQFPSGHWYERINIFTTTGAQFAYFALINKPTSSTSLVGNIIELKHLDHDDSHFFTSASFSINTDPIIIHAATTDAIPTASSTITTTDDLWDVISYSKPLYIELTTTGNKSPIVFVRDGSYEVPEGVRTSDYQAYFNFAAWNDATKYMITVALEKVDETDESTWTASITSNRIVFTP